MMHQDKKGPEDVGLYDRLLKRTEELLDSGRKNLDDALQKASEEIASAGDFTRERADRVAAFVKRDARHAVEGAQDATKQLREAVDPKRVSAGAQSVFAKIMLATSSKLSDWAEKSEQSLEFKTGEVTSPGTLTCKNCQEELHLKKTTKIPPCPKCHQSLFRKSY
jgi:Zn finger protein HypA/HybF involved in hydrogenase expression